MKANTEEWFKEADFRADVVRYMKRQRLTPEGVALWTDISSGTIRNFIKGGMLSLRVAAGLSELCDLSIDSYRLDQSQHDAVVEVEISAEFLRGRQQLVQQMVQINENLRTLRAKGNGDIQERAGKIEEGQRRLAPRTRFR